MNTPNREALRRSEASRRRSGRQALAVIPNVPGMTTSPGETISLEVNTMDNVMNSRHGIDAWSPAPSPDELVIQKRGRRRKTIVWSPDLDACKRDSLLSLSLRDRTPVKSPNKTTMVLRSTPRKRLSLGDTSEVRLATSERKRKPLAKSSQLLDMNSVKQKFNGNLANGLKGLSHDQLVSLIMDLVSMQEEGVLCEGDKLRDVLLSKMPVADVEPLREKLNSLRQNVYTSLICPSLDESAYSKAYTHLDAYQKMLIDQGKRLMESQHWTSVMQYVFVAWSITKELPEWENQGLDNTTYKCFKSLAQFCNRALKEGCFALPTLDLYGERLKTMLNDCEDVDACLKLLNDIKYGNV